jgi:hypothetical protein
MNDFVKQAVSKLGLDVETAQSGAGALFKAARNNLSSEDYAKLSENVEDVDGLIAKSPQEGGADEGIGGMAKGLLGKATEALGGDKGGSLGIGALLGAAGISTDQMPGFVNMFIDYIRDKVGSDVAGNLLSKMSGLLDLKAGEATT